MESKTLHIEEQYGLQQGDDWLPVYWQQKQAAEESLPRIFKINGKTITETEAMRQLSIEEIQATLISAYPEIRSATYNSEIKDGQQVISFMPRPGRKG